MSTPDAIIKRLESEAQAAFDTAPHKSGIADVEYLRGKGEGLLRAAEIIKAERFIPSKRWCDLVAGDEIVCPATGQPEKVTWARNGGAGKWAVRTSGHDHVRPFQETVELWVNPITE